MNIRRLITCSSCPASLLAIVVAAVGCAAQTPVARSPRAAGEWTFRLPETHSPYANLAIGQGGQPSTLGLVDDALASTAGPERAAREAKPRKLAATQLAKQSAAPAPQPIAAAPATPAPIARPEQPEQLALNTPPVTTSEEQRYAQRESQSQKQRDFRGGDAIVISLSALVIIVLVVILILLLT
ncbi:MAG TPA: hypothetical protein VJV78_10155 [Polyangiales bacterium]|nr:hypothetical protein [Polyangiales bacterium]